MKSKLSSLLCKLNKISDTSGKILLQKSYLPVSSNQTQLGKQTLKQFVMYDDNHQHLFK